MPRDMLPMKDVQATIRHGELQESDNPWISEWGNPAGVMPCHPLLNT